MTIRNMSPSDLAALTCEQMIAAIFADNVVLKQLPPWAQRNIELDILDCLQAADGRTSLATFADIAFEINNRRPSAVMAVCANCYHTTLCADDGEAFICVNTAQCRANRANPVFTCDECGRETHARMNGACPECVEREWMFNFSADLAQQFGQDELS